MPGTKTEKFVRHGWVVETPLFEGARLTPRFWIVEKGALLGIDDDAEMREEREFIRAHFVEALSKVLRKRNDDEYVPLDPDVPESKDEAPEDEACFSRSGDFIVYTHTCGETRCLPRAAARELLNALTVRLEPELERGASDGR